MNPNRTVIYRISTASRHARDERIDIFGDMVRRVEDDFARVGHPFNYGAVCDALIRAGCMQGNTFTLRPLADYGTVIYLVIYKEGDAEFYGANA